MTAGASVKIAHHDEDTEEHGAMAAYGHGNPDYNASAPPNAAGFVFVGLVAVIAVAAIAGAIVYNYRGHAAKRTPKNDSE